MKENMNTFELIDSLISKEMQTVIGFDCKEYPIFERWMFEDKILVDTVLYLNKNIIIKKGVIIWPTRCYSTMASTTI